MRRGDYRPIGISSSFPLTFLSRHGALAAHEQEESAENQDCAAI